MEIIHVKNSLLIDSDDFTFYRKPKGGDPLGGAASQAVQQSYKGGGSSISGRSLICKCFGGQWLSVTLRSRAQDRTFGRGKPVPLSLQIDSCGWKPSPNTNNGTQFSTSQLCAAMQAMVFQEAPAKGMLVIAGATGSAKSQVARGLVHHYLSLHGRGLRNGAPPHLVTYEDPIEVPFYDLDCDPNAEARNCGVAYTPRQNENDCDKQAAMAGDTPRDMALKRALEDALRQTPAVYYVGEIRREEDWRAALEFAGSGHLLVTTAHAGSLVEAMDRILSAVGATTPAARGQVAQRILAVVHQRRVSFPSGQSLIVPALWTQTPGGIASLVSDGLASVLPHNPCRSKGVSSFGRMYFARELAGRVKNAGHAGDLERECLRLDLAGL